MFNNLFARGNSCKRPRMSLSWSHCFWTSSTNHLCVPWFVPRSSDLQKKVENIPSGQGIGYKSYQNIRSRKKRFIPTERLVIWTFWVFVDLCCCLQNIFINKVSFISLQGYNLNIDRYLEYTCIYWYIRFSTFG